MSTEHNSPASDERRQVIVDTALKLLDDGGIDKLSLRRLAANLGMHAPGLYWYIESKQDLTDLMAAAILSRGLADLGTPGPDRPWDEWLVDLACATRRALLSHRDGARVVGGAFMIRTGALTPAIEASLEILEEAGFPRLLALGATMTLIRYAVGAALGEQLSPLGSTSEPADAERIKRELALAIDEERWPRTSDAYRQLFESDIREKVGMRDRDRVFRWGAETFVRGFATFPGLPGR